MGMFRSLAVGAILAACLLLAGCAGTGPYNTSADGADDRLMLKGHDPVAYFTLGKHVPGQAGIKTAHDGVTYRFATEEHRQTFIKAPDRFVPQYGGFCSNGIVYAIPWGGDPDTWKIIDGRLYIFGGEGSRKYFVMDEQRNRELADRYWKDEVRGTVARLQSWKRLVMRVPHYRTGKELEQEWQARKTGQPVAEPRRAM